MIYINENKPCLIALIGPSASGKTHILNEWQSQGLPFLVGTTTRAPRPGEVDGIDYHFISEDESIQLSSDNAFIENVIYSGVRYGVTHTEFNRKIANGAALFIIEPSGMEKYRQYCQYKDVEFIPIFVQTDNAVRFERLKSQAFNGTCYTESGVDRIIRSAVLEDKWANKEGYAFRISGEESPKQNVTKILSRIGAYDDNHVL